MARTGPSGDQTRRPARLPTHIRDVFAASTDGVAVTDESGAIIFVNSSLEEMSGYDRHELLGEAVEKLVPRGERGSHDAEHRRYRQAPIPRLMGQRGGLRLQRRDGSIADVEIALAPMTLGSQTLTVATVRDLSPRLALESERSLLLEVLGLVPDAVVVTDAAALRVEYVNDAAAALVGRPATDLAGETNSPLRPELTPMQQRELVDQLAGQEPPDRFVDAVVTRPGGDQVPVELHLRLMTSAVGSRHLVTVARDQRDQLEQRERLRASEEAFRTVFERAPTGAAVIAVTGAGSREIVMANQALAEMLHCAVPDLIGSDVARFAVLEGADASEDLFAEVVSGQTAQLSRALRYRRADGSLLWAQVRANRIALPENSGPLLLAHWVDITDRVAQQSRQGRQAVLGACVAQVATAVLADERPEGVLNRIAVGARSMLDGVISALGQADLAAGIVTVDAVASDGAVEPGARGEFPLVDREIIDRLRHEETVALAASPPDLAGEVGREVGPLAVARFGDDDSHVGYLSVFRAAGAEPFTDEECADLGRLATQARLALQLARAHADQHRLGLLEDRQRIARELHDGVIQNIIALGMQLAAEVDNDPHSGRAHRDLERLDSLEQVVGELRRVVFELRVPARHDLGAAIHELAREAERVLGHPPDVVVVGPTDTVPAGLVDDLLGVLRETLSNVARHAHASHTSVLLTIDPDAVTLTVEDDGRGLPAAARSGGYGISNIEQRAAARHGHASVERGERGGTRVTWTCPLPPADPA